MDFRVPSGEMRDYIVELGAETLKLCMQCGLCSGLCPWRLVPGATGAAFNVRFMQRLAQMGLDGFERERELFACSTCGLCQSNCPRGVRIIDNIRAMRASLVSMGSAPRNLKPILSSLHANGNPWSGARPARTAWQEGLNIPAFGRETEYLFFVCCHSCFDPASIRIARSVAKLLTDAGVSFGTIGPGESCCGESARKAGDEELFQRLAQSNINLFRSRGVRKIVTTSPHCLWSFKTEYPELGAEWTVVHYTELLVQMQARAKASFKESFSKRVAFHDPCYLGRHCGVYDAPRLLLEAIPGVRTVELPGSRELSLCCGGGGGRIWAETPRGERFSELRVRDAVAGGVDVLVSACPYCFAMLTDATKSLKVENLEVKDLSEILAAVA